jgi:cyclopropane-fatty-acyl-phospholipid synthase
LNALSTCDWRALLRLATGGSVGWYQAWEAGEWDSPDPVPLFALFMDNGARWAMSGARMGPWRVLARALHWLQPQHPQGGRCATSMPITISATISMPCGWMPR